jgi:hypothetical protein
MQKESRTKAALSFQKNSRKKKDFEQKKNHNYIVPSA